MIFCELASEFKVKGKGTLVYLSERLNSHPFNFYVIINEIIVFMYFIRLHTGFSQQEIVYTVRYECFKRHSVDDCIKASFISAVFGSRVPFEMSWTAVRSNNCSG